MRENFSDVSRLFLDWAAKCMAPSTVYVYGHYVKQWIERWGDSPIAAITPAQLREWGTTWHRCQAIQRVCRWAAEEARIIDVNPLSGVKRPPKGRRRRILTPAEMIAWLRSAPPDLRRLLIGYRETMSRPQELRLATWADVAAEDYGRPIEQALSLGRACIVLYEWKDWSKRRDVATPRVIVLSPRACRLLLRLWLRRTSDDAPIFATSRGRAWTANALRCRFRRLRDRLAVKPDRRGETIVPYTFRHTSATQAAAVGVRDRLLADLLGHVETKTTARYCHLSTKHLRDAMATLWESDEQPGKKCKTTPAS